MRPSPRTGVTVGRRLALVPAAAGLVLGGRARGPARDHAGLDGTTLVTRGRGVQIYACRPTGDAYAWRLTAPDAVLTDSAGRRVGHHFAGPSWQAEDGSTVVGEAVATSPAPQAGAIPWVVLRATAHTGAGAFAGVAYVVRSQTSGGLAPAAGCDAAHAAAEARVAYTATYTFFVR